ncbi:MAG: hypothetical protein ACHQF4_07710, partial [Sphingobacteriales bacterium]
MLLSTKISKLLVSLCLLLVAFTSVEAQSKKPKFHVIAFYTGKNDLAHINFVHEANNWFPKMA